MCELFGASLKRRTDLSGYLAEFYSHSVRHPHGWGIAYEGGDEMKLVKQPVCAAESEILSGVIDGIGRQKCLLAHIRYATVGATRQENCHPFSGRDISGRQWTLIHNGTVYSGMILTKYLDLQQGETDSERVFLYLIDCINEALRKNPDPSCAERFAVFDEAVKTLSPRNKLNLMLYDGEVFYVHKNMEGTMSYKKTADGTLFSTVPLDPDGWQDLPMCRAFAFREGEKFFEGEPHANVFVQTLNSITEFDAMNI